ncbi:MAG: oligosaccharide flippase family protein [bacterium]
MIPGSFFTPLMSRSKRFVTNLLSSYAAIGINILYTLASIPLALHYLDKEEFGLWALVTQLSGYLMLLEFGMTGSVARSLSDHKDQMEDGIYGNILRTGARVFVIQGLLVFLLGLLMAWCAPSLLGLPARLQQPFMVLMATQALLSGIKLSMGSIASPLWCHQRLDLSNFAASASLVVTFTVLWLGFHTGWHLYSLVISTAAGSLVGLLITYISCRRLGLYAPKAYRGRFDPVLFKQLFHFGGDLFLLNLGAQLLSASQVIVVSRLLGIESAAVWVIATKIFSMAQQFVSKILESSAGALAEIMVRKETDTLKRRFHDVVAISAVMAVAASAGIALINGPFVEIWTAGKVTWAPWNNFLLACVLFSTAVTRCHTGLVGISKEIRGMKYVNLVEGVAFVVFSVASVKSFGFAGILISALVCNICITGAYGVTRTASHFKIRNRHVAGWIARPAIILLLTLALFPLTLVPFISALGELFRFGVGAGIFIVCILPAIWFIGLDSRLKLELTAVFSRITGKFLSAMRMA